MKVFIDTNILISSMLNPNGTPYQAYIKAVTYPNKAVICTQNIEELIRIFNKKFPHRLDSLNRFLSDALLSIEVVPVPSNKMDDESLIRDVADRPILRAAIENNIDIFLTGDKDFLEADIDFLSIMTASDFLKL